MLVNGSYKGYQGSIARAAAGGQNFGAHITDPRLRSLVSAHGRIFENKRILDVGCNKGSVPVDIALHFKPKSITGIDIDSSLIFKAKSHLSFAYSRIGPAGEPNYFPASSVQEHGHTPYPPLSSSTELKFPHNVSFVCRDFAAADVEGKEEEGEDGDNVDEEGRKQNSKFDVILLLSVVKWMHLSRGDDGLLRVFEKVSRLLEEDGCVIIELQDWKSYENAAKKNPGLRAKLEDIKVRPETFESVLSDRFGLEVVGRLGGQGETSSRKGVGKYFMLKREIWLLKRS